VSAEYWKHRAERLEAQLKCCRAANLYDANAHKRVAELEAALKERDYALRAISQWDMLNPVRTDLIGDLGWLKTLVAPFVTGMETPEAMHARIVTETADAVAKERGLPQTETSKAKT
jgi:hypothetical protein